MAEQKPHLLVFVQHKKCANVDEETFYKWYKEELNPEAVRLVKKYNILRYAVFYTPSGMRKPFEEEFHNKLQKPHWTVPDWDAATCYWVYDPDDLRALQADPEWTSRVNKMEEGWIDGKEISISIGHEIPYFENGEVKNTTVAAD
ncbi:uncharacterized protein F4822DRAFT_428449 [Hypoxylon trugodes]|uniref:uncharacterized protein n=1 Tax=Hypoxylon trugodes TaxID=326681 RepID=UPI002198EC32|nr:uncharacterized protein F4822DRAFT_428449 [Hypoxylon trugodes]KAI1390106.1 hypothetical protein F4822DRAFT_428449 [Hypoxylon trugodes]